ncbi:MAG: T9SS type A sorting domain-containing protein [Bacteroidota bacterium]
MKNIPVVLDSGGTMLQKMYTDNYGRYSFQTGYGNYQVMVDTINARYHVVCPVSFLETSILTAIDSIDTDIDFGVDCNSGYDLTARSISPAGIFSIGHSRTLYLNTGEELSYLGILCGNSIAGSVEAILSGLVSYISPAVGALTPTSINGDTIIWNISNFSLVDPQHDFNIIVGISPNATINDSVCVELNVSPTGGDNIPSNNSLSECFPIRNAVDPNEKYMSPSGLVDTSQQWFTFTIFFQNTGNAPAEDIYVLDTMDQNLDPTTFAWLSSSHDVITQLLPGNILRFNYPGINLVDSTTDEAGSQGYVQYKVRRKENLPANTTISNTAYIYFDFNAPVATNTVAATLTLNVSTADNAIAEFNIYPNPARNKLTVGSKQYAIKSIEVCDILGKKLMSEHFDAGIKSATIDVEGLSQGIYFIKLQTEKYIATRKFVKSPCR